MVFSIDKLNCVSSGIFSITNVSLIRKVSYDANGE